MELPRQPRLDATGPVRVTFLGGEGRQVPGRAMGLSDGCLRLLVEEAAAPGTALRVEWDDSEVLGEVRYCEARPDGFALGISIEHALVGTRELARLANRLLGDSEPDAVRHR
ncbi:MAG TPA: hypothetical protein VHA11_09175 [Bryobacteraceae bacterium]|nr:hypothetical protein [Bryobacteraceae bacterium]